MPEILVETTVDIEEYVDVDIESILDDCSEKEIEKVIKWLKEGEYLSSADIVMPSDMHYNEEMFHKNVSKLQELYLRMSVEDYTVIETILKKY